MFRELANIKINDIKEFEDLIRQGIINERKRIDEYKCNLINEQFESDYIDALNDDRLQLLEIEDTCKLLIIVKLRIIVEAITKRLLLWTFNSTSNEERNIFLRELSKHKNVLETLKKINIIPEATAEFTVIDELRCLCNAIKHGVIVDNELSGFPIWSSDKGKEIDANKIDLRRFYDSIPKYVYELSEKVKQYLLSIRP